MNVVCYGGEQSHQREMLMVHGATDCAQLDTSKVSNAWTFTDGLDGVESDRVGMIQGFVLRHAQLRWRVRLIRTTSRSDVGVLSRVSSPARRRHERRAQREPYPACQLSTPSHHIRRITRVELRTATSCLCRRPMRNITRGDPRQI